MDICLHQYGHCNYISSHHACLTLDKVCCYGNNQECMECCINSLLRCDFFLPTRITMNMN